MAEDDEVDVLGDYSFDILNKNDSFDGTPLVSQNSDLLNCEYTIHPQWLLDKPSANPALWYDTSDLDVSDYDQHSEPTILHQQNSINDESGWTEKEKDLLNRGIEIFGKSNLNLSQFIGSRTPAEVKYFLKNFYSDVQSSYTSVNEDILFDNCVEETVVTSTNVLQEYEIPASIEEVIDAVSTAQTTISPRKRTNSSKSTRRSVSSENISYDDVPSGQSLLKLNYQKARQENVLQGNQLKARQKNAKVKFKTKINIASKNFGKLKKNRVLSPIQSKKPERQEFPKQNKHKKVVKSPRSHRSQSESDSSQKSHSSQEKLKNCEVKKDLRIVTGKGLSVPVCDGEQVVKIIKENDSESDSDIDVDVEDDEKPTLDATPSNNFKTAAKEAEPKVEAGSQEVKQDTPSHPSRPQGKDSTTNANKINMNKIANNLGIVNKVLPKRGPQLEELPEEVLKQLLSMEEPTSEVLIDRGEISEVEKFLFFEFFENRPTKTPQRYLHIRNHILETWKSSKPKYVRKTTIRNGLKQAGDVNLVGRIHTYLEQIAAINFSCEQTNYNRPLLEIAAVTPPTIKEKSFVAKSDIVPRQRIKKKYTNDGEGGYTLTHDEKGEIINTTVVNEEPVVKQRSYLKKPSIRLVYCRAFTEDYPQKYSITLDISTLILMDLHAHMHHTEVMGLLGGHWSPETKRLVIKRYVPCRNVASSLTHCDMCPVSQARAADALHGEQLDILGWYHSHPTFAPEPSQQDIETQLSVQRWIGNRTPCMGLILSPFSLHGALIASPYRCMIVNRVAKQAHSTGEGAGLGLGREEGAEDEEQLVPYKFKVELVVERFQVRELIERAKQVLKDDISDCEKSAKSRVDFNRIYFQDNSITYLDKFIYSVKMHLAKCSGINKMTCDAVVDGLTRICTHYSKFSQATVKSN